jgi:HK97 family phage portal protein
LFIIFLSSFLVGLKLSKIFLISFSTFLGSIPGLLLANSGKPLILEEGMKYERLSLSNEDSQFLDTRRFQKSEIAALFKVPPYMLGDMSKATFNNMEQMMTNFVMTCLMPHAVNFELAARKYLFRNKAFYVKFNLNSLMRGDFKTRTDGYRTLINIGAITPNEVRELEEFNSKGSEADELYMQMNMTTLKKINEGDGNATNKN